MEFWREKNANYISLYLWMRQNNDPVLIYLSLVVKADDVDASLRVKGEVTISSYITSSWWVGWDEAASKTAFVSFTLAFFAVFGLK